MQSALLLLVNHILLYFFSFSIGHYTLHISWLPCNAFKHFLISSVKSQEFQYSYNKIQYNTYIHREILFLWKSQRNWFLKKVDFSNKYNVFILRNCFFDIFLDMLWNKYGHFFFFSDYLSEFQICKMSSFS